jgi:hypothetical protein
MDQTRLLVRLQPPKVVKVKTKVKRHHPHDGSTAQGI